MWGDGEWVRVAGVWPYRAADCGVARPGSGLVGRSPVRRGAFSFFIFFGFLFSSSLFIYFLKSVIIS